VRAGGGGGSLEPRGSRAVGAAKLCVLGPNGVAAHEAVRSEPRLGRRAS
jgi:hypothetical protein